MNSKKTIILILALIVILLGASAYIAWKGRKARIVENAPGPKLTEEEVLRTLAPLTAPKLSAEEVVKEKATLKQLGAKTNKLSPSDTKKEKEILRILSAPNN